MYCKDCAALVLREATFDGNVAEFGAAVYTDS